MSKEPRDLRAWLKATDIDLSRAIRIEASDSRGVCQCITCPAALQWDGGIQAGHFKGKDDSIRFFEMGINCQCSTCNCTGLAHTAAWAGQKIEMVAHAYMKYMLGRYSLRGVDAFILLKNQEKHWTIEELRPMRIWYKVRLKEAKEARGL